MFFTHKRANFILCITDQFIDRVYSDLFSSVCLFVQDVYCMIVRIVPTKVSDSGSDRIENSHKAIDFSGVRASCILYVNLRVRLVSTYEKHQILA